VARGGSQVEEKSATPKEEGDSDGARGEPASKETNSQKGVKESAQGKSDTIELAEERWRPSFYG